MSPNNVEWNGDIGIGITLGEYLEMSIKHEKAKLAMELLSHNETIPRELIETLNDYIESVDDYVLFSILRRINCDI